MSDDFVENKAGIRRTENLSDGSGTESPSDIRRMNVVPTSSRSFCDPSSIVTNMRGPTGHFREVYFWNGMKQLQ